MSVLIKGMKMPKGCVYCTFCNGEFGLSGEVKCYAKTKHGRKLPRAYNIHDWRPEWCPLVDFVDGERK